MTNLEKLESIFPECITETQDADGNLRRAIDFEKLRQILTGELSDEHESYEFNFVDKKRAHLEAYAPIRKTMRPVISESRDFDSTQNIYIEGDNLDALKLLAESYLGKVKMIYIDPPYNTGNDFIYRDDFTQDVEDYEADTLDESGDRLFANRESRGRFHSDWCAMIYSRLLIAKHFLSKDGVIFISIDDHEQANLKKMCDEIFGEKNFVAQITVVTNPSGRHYGGIAQSHEYILIYRKSEALEINLVTDAENKFTLFDELGGFSLREIRNRNIRFNDKNRPNLYYPFYVDTSAVDGHGLNKISLEARQGWVEVYPMESQGVKTVWRWGKEKAAANLNVNIMAKRKKDGGYMIVEKYREPKKMVRSVWLEKEWRNEKGTLLIKEIFGRNVFDYPKSLETLMRLIEMGTAADSVVMDFFSGSATTAQAVMEMNSQDGGRRKFIMIQLPEETSESSEAFRAGYKTICEIGKERIRRAGDKLKAEHPDLDIGFRVFRVDSSNFLEPPKVWTQQILDLYIENIRADRDEYDLFFGAILEMGLTLDKSFAEENFEGVKVLSYDGKILACFERNIPAEIFRALALRQPKRILFRDASFRNSVDKINALEFFKYFAPDTEVKVL